MPSSVQVITERGELAVVAGSTISIPIVLVANNLQALVSRWVVAVDGLKKITQAITTIELKVTHGVIAVARAQALIVVTAAFVLAEVQHLIAEGHGLNRRGRRTGTRILLLAFRIDLFHQGCVINARSPDGRTVIRGRLRFVIGALGFSGCRLFGRSQIVRISLIRRERCHTQRKSS